MMRIGANLLLAHPSRTKPWKSVFNAVSGITRGVPSVLRMEVSRRIFWPNGRNPRLRDAIETHFNNDCQNKAKKRNA